MNKNKTTTGKIQGQKTGRLASARRSRKKGPEHKSEIGNCAVDHARRKDSTRTNTGGHNEETGCNGIQTKLLSPSRSPVTTKAATVEPGSSSTGDTDSISVGQSRSLDTNTNSVTGSSQSKKQINATNTIPKKVTQPERKRHLKIGTWNVRHGLIRREHEIVNLIESEEVDVLFLTETDTGQVNASNFKLQGYETFIQSCTQKPS